MARPSSPSPNESPTSPSPRAAAGSTAEHRTVARVMSMLEFVLASEPNGVRLADLSAAIEAPKSSVHGLAKGLASTGYFREDRGRYFIGPAISSLLAVGPVGLPSSFHHALEELTARWQETSLVATVVGDSVVYLDMVQPDTIIRATPALNQRLPLWPRSAGKCVLAFMEPKRLESYLRRHHPGSAEQKHVREELARVRETHVGINIGETNQNHVGIASPILNGDAPVSVVVVLVGLKSRLENRIHEAAQSVREAAESLSPSARR